MQSIWSRFLPKPARCADACYGPLDVRHPKVVAGAALIAVLAAVAVPGSAGSRAPSPIETPAPDLFTTVEVAAVRGPVMTTEPLDPEARSAGSLAQTSTMVEPAPVIRRPAARPKVGQPDARADVIVKNTWRVDGNISWYGPGFYGNRTACGQRLTTETLGVAHKTLPCGTRVAIRSGGRSVVVPVIDRGPYARGIAYDLTGATARRLGVTGTARIGAAVLNR